MKAKKPIQKHEMKEINSTQKQDIKGRNLT